MPKGFYLITNTPIQKTTFVVIPSTAVNNYGLHLPRYLLKTLVAYHGELVTIDEAGLSLDNRLIAKRILYLGFSFHGVLQPGKALILGESERSFDSRYFGPVNLCDLTPVRPLLTW